MGPTACGKSALALEIAAARPAVIINMDAMQMVRDLRIITARPTVAEEQQAEHALYGVLAAHEPTSVAAWLKLVEPIIRDAWMQEKLPVLVGGTGMYLKALMEGLAAVPKIPHEVREVVRAMSPGQVRAQLESRDPAMAAALKPGDSQRNARALEVLEATGISLSEWQQRPAEGMFPNARYAIFAVNRPRAEIYKRIDARFENMMNAGALEEVQALMDATSMPASGVSVRDWCLGQPPIYRAHGVPELMAFIRGEMSRQEAISKGQQNTRNYAKRQLTWLRNQLPQALEVQEIGQILPHLN